MRARFVNENVEEENIINEGTLDEIRGLVTREKLDALKHYPVFKRIAWGYIANEIQRPPAQVMMGDKIDPKRFYNYLVKMRGINITYEKMREILMEAAPILGIVKYIKFDKEDAQELKYTEKVLHNELSLDYFDNAEVDPEDTEGDVIVLRSADGDTDPVYYQFDKKLATQEGNMLKLAYAFSHGNPEKTLWKNYLDARPATLSHILKHKKSVHFTKGNPEDFGGKEYN